MLDSAEEKAVVLLNAAVLDTVRRGGYGLCAGTRGAVVALGGDCGEEDGEGEDEGVGGCIVVDLTAE